MGWETLHGLDHIKMWQVNINMRLLNAIVEFDWDGGGWGGMLSNFWHNPNSMTTQLKCWVRHEKESGPPTHQELNVSNISAVIDTILTKL